MGKTTTVLSLSMILVLSLLLTYNKTVVAGGLTGTWYIYNDYNGNGAAEDDEIRFYSKVSYSAPDKASPGSVIDVQVEFEYLSTGEYLEYARENSFRISLLRLSIRSSPSGEDLKYNQSIQGITLERGAVWSHTYNLAVPDEPGTYYIILKWDAKPAGWVGVATTFDIGRLNPTECPTIKVEEAGDLEFHWEFEGIPGFPIEGIVVGMALALGMIALLRRRRVKPMLGP